MSSPPHVPQRILEIPRKARGVEQRRCHYLLPQAGAQRGQALKIEQARQYGRLVAAKVGVRFSSWQSEARPERLRVGLVSGDLLSHPVGFFLEGLLAHIDPARIELIAYPTHHKEDKLTARIRPYFSAWKPLIGKSDEAAAHLIHADGVHVLFDLSGHTAHNRLPVFAWKPAPVQVTWLGLPATTGVAEMDYVLGDPYAIPTEFESHFSEAVWRMPKSCLWLAVPASHVKVAQLPAFSAG